MDEVTKQAFLSAVRSLLMVLGTSLAARGFVHSDSINDAVGAVMVIIPIVWGVWDKYKAERMTKARETVAVQAGVNAAVAATGPRNGIALFPVTHEDAQEIIKTFTPAPVGDAVPINSK